MNNPGTAAVLTVLISGMGRSDHGLTSQGIGLLALQLVNPALITVLVGYVTLSALDLSDLCCR